MSDEKKTDKVISMEEFKKSAEPLSDSLTVDEVFDIAEELNFKRLLIVGEAQDGTFRCLSNYDSIFALMFTLELLKKMMLDDYIEISQ